LHALSWTFHEAVQVKALQGCNNAISEMDKVVQNNAATAEESASASEEMNAQAEQLKAIVEQLAAIVSGSRQARPAVDASPSGRPVRPVKGKKAGRASSALEAMIPFDDGNDAFGDF
jgi:methyl-accepting chemotaxis protein